MSDERPTDTDHHTSSSSTLIAPDREDARKRADAHVYERVSATEQESDLPRPPDAKQPAFNTREDSGIEPCENVKTRTLARRRFQWCFSTPLDVLLALSPLFFLVIAGLCLSLNNRPKSKYGEDIKAITLLSPTIFPIVYAAILGKMLRRVGLFKAERSATIGTVERLIGCQSLFSTFERQFAFRHVDILGFTILLAWLLSPLGGQASLRMLSSEPVVTSFRGNVQYFPVEAYYPSTYMFGSGEPERTWPLWGPLYMTALQTSRQSLHLPMDLFQNVKIPDLRQPNTSFDRLSGYDWHDFSGIEGIEYTSILGLPLAGVPKSANSTFNATSFYWSIDCDSWKQKNFTATEYKQTPSFNLTLDAEPNREDSLYNRIRFLYKTRQVTQQTFRVYAEPPYVNISAILSTVTCYATPLVVESNIVCQDRSCGVQSMRRVQRDARHLLSINDPIVDFLGTLFNKMPGAGMVFTGETGTQSSELVEQWIADPNLHQFTRDQTKTLSANWPLEQRFVNLALLSPPEFSRRLQIAMNTFWDASVGSNIRMGNFTLDQVKSMSQDAPFTWNSTELAGVKYDGEKYVCNITFASITIAISFALFATAVVSLVLGIFTKAPDTLGFVSTSARDNPYFTRPVASHLDGLEAARELRDVRIRIGDVNSMSETGHVAFASMEAGPKRVSRKRLYD